MNLLNPINFEGASAGGAPLFCTTLAFSLKFFGNFS